MMVDCDRDTFPYIPAKISIFIIEDKQCSCMSSVLNFNVLAEIPGIVFPWQPTITGNKASLKQFTIQIPTSLLYLSSY